MKALLVNKDEEGNTSAAVTDLTEDMLPEGNVTVAVDYSSLNYKMVSASVREGG